MQERASSTNREQSLPEQGSKAAEQCPRCGHELGSAATRQVVGKAEEPTSTKEILTVWEKEVKDATGHITDPVERRRAASQVRREQEKYRRRVLQALGRT